MGAAAWLADTFGEPIDPADLRLEAAERTVRYVQRHARSVAAFVECRRGGEGEIVVLDMETGRPQGGFNRSSQHGHRGRS